MIRRLSLLAPLALVVAGIALAASAQAQDTPRLARSGAYALEPTHAQVMFGVSHLGFSTYYGQFPGATGTLVLDADHPAASRLDVSVPVAGLWTASAELIGELKGPDWLNAAAFPTMTFHATAITPTGPATADVAGDLTLHGVTRPVVLKAAFTRGGDSPMTKSYMIGFEVTGHIRRSDFGVSKYVPLVGDDVDLIISAPFERKAP